MPDGLWLLLGFILIVVIYTVARVVRLNRLSDDQWKKVDKSKLREWDDDEDW